MLGDTQKKKAKKNLKNYQNENIRKNLGYNLNRIMWESKKLIPLLMKLKTQIKIGLLIAAYFAAQTLRLL